MFPIISKKTLRHLGLSDTQIKIYFSILQNPGISISDISKNINSNRQQIYNDTDKLISFGLVDKTKRGGRTFIPANPQRLLELAKNKESDAKESVEEITEIIPRLELLKGSFSTKMTIRYYEGLKQIEDAYNTELLQSKNAEILSFAGSVDEIFKYFPEEYWQKWNKKFVTNNNSSRMLTDSTEISKMTREHDTSYNRQTKSVAGLNMKVNIDVFENNVLIVSFQDKSAVWIESRVVADSYRTLFESLWRTAM
jgi:predicted transcriptional regulator